MNAQRKVLWMPLAGVLTLGATASASVLTAIIPVGLEVPDANPSGLVSSVYLPTSGYRITDVDVTLSLSANPTSFGGWNGDLYAWLSHGGELSILLNRPGRSLADPLGYADAGFEVTLDDEAGGDVHLYQLSWSGSAGPLTGSWQPDARLVDPAVVLDTDGRTASAALSVFDGLDPFGDWNLFVADLDGGGGFVLKSWQLSVTVEPIPEPATAGLLTGLFSLAWGVARRPRAKPGEVRY